MQAAELSQLLFQPPDLVDDCSIGFGEGFQARTAFLNQLAGVGQLAVFLIDLVQLARLQAQRIQLFDLISQKLQFGGVPGAGVARLLQRLLQPAELPGLFAYREQWCLIGQKGIEQFPLHVRPHQSLVLVLAVNFDQRFAEFAQRCELYGAAIDECAGAALR